MDWFKVLYVAAIVLIFQSCVTACVTNEKEHRKLIDSLKTSDYVKSVMNLTDRGCFVKKDPYSLRSQLIGHGGSILDPYTVSSADFNSNHQFIPNNDNLTGKIFLRFL
ncbi:unnamed protein product [Trichobilharzia regenti]|nr:unnamed protein product [Trichobilharzia regenti]